MRPPSPGLCGRCRHARTVESDRGSRFWLCRLANRDPSYRRYPRLPVLRCQGFEPRSEGERDGDAAEDPGPAGARRPPQDEDRPKEGRGE